MSKLTQPTLPPEGLYGEIERLFIEESPPGLWPENQDSNFGTIRRIITLPLQDASDEMTTIFNERFIDTAVALLTLHENQVNLPAGNALKSLAQRRADIKTRKKKGAFTRVRRDNIIRDFINATYGTSLQLGPDGLVLDAGGLALFSDASGPYQALFRVYEDIRNFSYEVWIRNDVTPDLVGMLRELKRITPAGISFAITEKATAALLSYFRAVRTKQPVGYYRLDSLAFGQDDSGYGNTGTANGGGPLALAIPGLLHANVDDNAAGVGNGAADFDGVDDYISVPHAAQLNVGDIFSLEAWVRPDVLQLGTILSKGTNGFHLRMTAAGLIELVKEGVAVIVASTVALVAGTTYYVVATKNGAVVKLWINAVDRTGTVTNQTIVNTSSILAIGRRSDSATEFFNGVIDEFSVYNFPLTAAEVLNNYNTGKFIA